MSTTETHRVHHGDLVTLTEDADGATSTYRFVDQYKPSKTDGSDAGVPSDLFEILTAGSAIGQRLLSAKVGDTLTITYLDHTFIVHFLAH
jgi:hypothetical protein